MESATQITTSVKDDESTVEAIRKFMSEKLGFSLAKSDESKNKVCFMHCIIKIWVFFCLEHFNLIFNFNYYVLSQNL